jgi:FAD/FMN-containing dehydrogenase
MHLIHLAPASIISATAFAQSRTESNPAITTRANSGIGVSFTVTSACTIGGYVAENSGGVYCLKAGLTVNNVEAVKMLTIDGEDLILSRQDEGLGTTRNHRCVVRFTNF